MGFPPGEQAPLSLSGQQHTPLSASWKTCRVGQVQARPLPPSGPLRPREADGDRDGDIVGGLVRTPGPQTDGRPLAAGSAACPACCPASLRVSQARPACTCLACSLPCRHPGTCRLSALCSARSGLLQMCACSRRLPHAAERAGGPVPRGSELERPGIHRSSAFSIQQLGAGGVRGVGGREGGRGEAINRNALSGGACLGPAQNGHVPGKMTDEPLGEGAAPAGTVGTSEGSSPLGLGLGRQDRGSAAL